MENSLKIMFYVLPAALGMDLILPFFFAPFYQGYHHRTHVMSMLGNNKSPLHCLYNLWLILLGIIILSGSLYLYLLIGEISVPLGLLFVLIMTAYGVGGCILAGVFPVGENKQMNTASSKIHGFSAAIGFMALLFAGLVLSLYFSKCSRGLWSVVSLVCFFLAILFFVLFVMADKPAFENSVISSEGLWQRLSLLFMYLPVILFCIKNII